MMNGTISSPSALGFLAKIMCEVRIVKLFVAIPARRRQLHGRAVQVGHLRHRRHLLQVHCLAQEEEDQDFVQVSRAAS